MAWRRNSYYYDSESSDADYSGSDSCESDSDNDDACTGCDGGCDECNDVYVARFLLASPLSDAALASPAYPARILYRSCLTGMSWDHFAPFTRPTDPDVQFRLWAASGRHAPKYWDQDELDNHIQMGWEDDTDSPFISFSYDLEWAVYYTLKQEFVGDEARALYQIQVPDDHIFECDGDDETAAAFVESASEAFAHKFVDVYAYEELEICARARDVAEEWFADRGRRRFPTYPFVEWSEYMTDVGCGMRVTCLSLGGEVFSFLCCNLVCRPYMHAGHLASHFPDGAEQPTK